MGEMRKKLIFMGKMQPQKEKESLRIIDIFLIASVVVLIITIIFK